MSKGALCATNTESGPAQSRNAGTAAAGDGAPRSIASVMPVSTAMNGGTGAPGSTSVWNWLSRWPPRTFTAPISVIRAPAAAEPPVVSRSTTTNVALRSGVPSSSKVPWTGVCSGREGAGRRAAGRAVADRAVADRAVADVNTTRTVGRATDKVALPRRATRLECDPSNLVSGPL